MTFGTLLILLEWSWRQSVTLIIDSALGSEYFYVVLHDLYSSFMLFCSFLKIVPYVFPLENM